MNIVGKTVIVTGSASGIGRHLANRLLDNGAFVCAVDRSRSSLRCSDRLLSIVADLRDEDQVREIVDRVEQTNGPPAIIINSAGVLQDGRLVKRVADGLVRMPLTQWNRVVDTNLTAQFLMTREGVASMLRCKVPEGLVLNISSVVSAGNAGQSNYAAAKAGLEAASRSWAMELREEKIRVVVLRPGLIRTPMLDRAEQYGGGPYDDNVIVGTCEDIWRIARTVIESGFINGVALQVDGGAGPGGLSAGSTWHDRPV